MIKHPMLILRGNKDVRVSVNSVKKLEVGYIVHVTIDTTNNDDKISVESVAESDTLDSALNIATMRALVQYNELVCDEEKLREICLQDLQDNPLKIETKEAMKEFIDLVMPVGTSFRFPDITLAEIGAIELHLNLRK